MSRNAGGFLGRASVVAGVWLAAALLVLAPCRALAQPVVSVAELSALGPGGLARSVFMPGEGIRYRARVDAAGAGPYAVRLVITGDGWYETHEAGPFSGSRTIEWGGPTEPLYTSGDASPGKVSLTLDVRSESGEPAVLRGRPQSYFTIRCPEGLPTQASEPLWVGINPWDMAFSKDNRFLYVTSQDSRLITVIDLDLWEIVSVLPPDWDEIHRQIQACQMECPPLDFACYDACVLRYSVVGRPAGVAAADLSTSGQRMVVSDYQREQIHVIERAGSRHWIAETISVPSVPPFNLPMNLSDVVANPSNELFTTDVRDNQLFRLNLDPPHLISRLNLRFVPGVGNAPLEVQLDPLAPNQNLYVLGVEAFKITRTGAPLDILNMNLFSPSLALRLNPDPARRWLYVLKGPVGPIDPIQPETSAYIYYWNLENPTPAGGSGAVLYDSSLWDMACIQKGELRGRAAYVLDAYRGQVRLLNLESRILLRGCGVSLNIGVGRLVEDPVRNRLYVTDGAAGLVRYLSAE